MSIPAQVQELIDGSGNTFHAKVARWLATAGWTATISPYYLDQSQQKARELDIIAEKVWPIKSNYDEWLGEVAVRLFIECKYLPGHSVFWFSKRDHAAIETLLCESGKFRPQDSYTGKHHYLSGSDTVAKLFTSSNARGQEAEPFYKALSQSLNGLVSMRAHAPNAFSTSKQSHGLQVSLDFPVIICNSFAQIYGVDFDGVRDTELVTDNFQLEVQYAYSDLSGRSQNELFLIDVVEFDQLSNFVSAIEEDARVAAFFARRD